jgi:hypothetical protein
MSVLMANENSKVSSMMKAVSGMAFIEIANSLSAKISKRI